MNTTGMTLAGAKSPAKSAPETASCAAAETPTAATGCVRLTIRVAQTRTTRTAASAEPGSSGRLISSTSESSTNVTARARSNQLLATALLTAGRSATAHDHR